MKLNKLTISTVKNIFSKKKNTFGLKHIDKMNSVVKPPAGEETPLIDLYGSALRICNNKIIPFFTDKKYLKYKQTDTTSQNAKFAKYDILALNSSSPSTGEDILFKQEAKNQVLTYINSLTNAIKNASNYVTIEAMKDYFSSDIDVDVDLLFPVVYRNATEKYGEQNTTSDYMLYKIFKYYKINNYFSTIYKFTSNYARSPVTTTKNSDIKELFESFEKLFKIGSLESNIYTLSRLTDNSISYQKKPESVFYSHMTEYYDAYIKNKLINDSLRVFDGYCIFLLSISYLREYLAYHYERSYGEKVKPIDGINVVMSAPVSNETPSLPAPIVSPLKPVEPLVLPSQGAPKPIELVVNSASTKPITSAYFGGDLGDVVYKRGKGSLQEIANMQATALFSLPLLIEKSELEKYFTSKNIDVRVREAILPVYDYPLEKIELGKPIDMSSNYIDKKLIDGIFGFRTSWLIIIFKMACIASNKIPKDKLSFLPMESFGANEREAMMYIISTLFPQYKENLTSTEIAPMVGPVEDPDSSTYKEVDLSGDDW